MTQWYVTVGVPGGEYAVKVDPAKEHCWNDMRDYFADVMESVRFRDAEPSEQQDGSVFYDFYIRPAPPELVEWLDAPYDEFVKNHQGLALRVAGGWLLEPQVQRLNGNGQWMDPETLALCFIPVALASGITVLGDE